MIAKWGCLGTDFSQSVYAHASVTTFENIYQWSKTQDVGPQLVVGQFRHSGSSFLLYRCQRYNTCFFKSTWTCVAFSTCYTTVLFLSSVFSHVPSKIEHKMKMCNRKLIYRLICNIDKSAKVCYSHNVVGIHTIRFETDTHWPVSVSKRTKYFGNGCPFQKRTSVS